MRAPSAASSPPGARPAPTPALRPVLGAAAIVLSLAAAADAHTAGGAFILLLPTHLYIIGGTLVVAASFILVALLPEPATERLAGLRWRLGVLPARAPAGAASLATLALVLLLVAAGFGGPRDPLANPLPLFVWSVWWIGVTVLHALFGNLWARLNPWSGLYRLALAAAGRARWREGPPLSYPAGAGYWPAVAGLLGFAWFELVHPAPADPAVLARVVTGYLLATFLAMVLFGERAWLQYGETFSVFFRTISWLSPLGARSPGPGCGGCPTECRRAPNCLACAACQGSDRPRALDLTLPALNLLTIAPLPSSAVAFVLLALASVSFDGLSRTFVWMTLIGENPLEYPGRTTLMVANTAGLLGLWATLAGAYALALGLGRQLGPLGQSPTRLRGSQVLSVVPIALGYHTAHYLPVFLVDAQQALRAASDPFGLGWDLFGTRQLPVVTSFLADPATLYPLWYTQLGLITAAHVAAVGVAHAISTRLERPPGDGRAGDTRAAGAPDRAERGGLVASQLPLVVLMIAYTMFGLWLLSTPAVG